MPSDTSTHGFLFADVRGYTVYLERHGARAASELLAQFRDLVRAAVATHDGAEIRTEGDSFYVVFPSASSAVACAMDIARDAAGARPNPVPVGIGVHAGESIETPEGPVGSAVNIAARLCALAPPGQVLVSDTVRALTRSVGSATYVPVGRKRLKGLEDEIRVFRAMPADAVPASTHRPRPWAARRPLVLAVGALALFAALALGRPLMENLIAGSGSTPSPTSRPSASASAGASVDASLYESVRFAFPFRIQLNDEWQLVGDESDVVAFFHPAPPTGWIDIIVVAAVVDPPCPTADPQFIGERPEDIINWLSSRPWLEHEAPRPYNVGRYLGRAVDIRVTDDGTEQCGHDYGALTFFRLGGSGSGRGFGELWTAEVGERKRIVAIDVNGRTVTLISGSPYSGVEQLWRKADIVLQSINFDSD